MKKEIISHIKKVASGFFKEWPITFKVEVKEEDESVKVAIETDQNDIFIQPNQDPLLAVQHILRLAVRKQFPDEMVRVLVDIGGFHKQQAEDLKKLSQEAIDKVIENEESVHLSPMSSFERRLVHVHVAENDKVESESAGASRDRHVVIKLKA